MGQEILRQADASGHVVRVVASLVRSVNRGEELAAIPERLLDPAGSLPGADVVIDFSLPEALPQVVELCLRQGLPLVSGTTGLSTAAEALLDSLAKVQPVIWARNFSVGIAWLESALSSASSLGPGWSASIEETHHRSKRDAPSGTALALRDALDSAVAVADIESIRRDDVIGEHRVILQGPDESIELVHRAEDRSIFAGGALRAARNIIGQPARRYQLTELLKL